MRHLREPLDDHDQQPAAGGLGDVPTAGAILDHFLHHAITIATSGRSHRVKDSLPAAPEDKKQRKLSGAFGRWGRELRARSQSACPDKKT